MEYIETERLSILGFLESAIKAGAKTAHLSGFEVRVLKSMPSKNYYLPPEGSEVSGMMIGSYKSMRLYNE